MTAPSGARLRTAMPLGLREHDDCALCRVIARPGEARKVQDTIIFSSPGFVLIPSIGPLAVGHVLLTARIHAPSLASMGPDSIAEYEVVRDRLLSLPAIRELGMVEVEHGSVDANPAGACVVHTHVHWFPGVEGLAGH